MYLQIVKKHVVYQKTNVIYKGEKLKLTIPDNVGLLKLEKKM